MAIHCSTKVLKLMCFLLGGRSVLPLALALEAESCERETLTPPGAPVADLHVEGGTRGGESLRKGREGPQRMI